MPRIESGTQAVKSVCASDFLCYIKLLIMQNKYLSALRTKYASFGLSKEALDRVASQRVKTITKEDEIEADIAGTETMLILMKELQGSTDAIRATAAQTQKELDALKASRQNAQQTNQNNNQQENPYAKEFAEMKELFTEMMGKLAANEKKAREADILGKVHTKMKELGCTNDFIRETTLKGIEIGESDTVDSIAEKYKPVYDSNCKSAFGDGYVPPKGNNAGGGEQDQAEITKILQSRGLLPKQN